VNSCASPLEEMDDSQAPAYTAQCPTPGVMAERTSTSSLDSQPHNQHHHRISFPGLHLGRSSSKDNYFHRSPASLDWKLESPPIVFYGDAESSTGALVSGQLFLNVMEEEGYEFESFNATLSVHVTQKRPFVAHCHDCSTQVTELKRWTFLERPLLLAKGQHAFPFSILLEGHLPTTLDGSLVSISYQFKAEATPKPTTSSHPVIKLEKTLDVKRVLLEHDTPHHSVRVLAVVPRDGPGSVRPLAIGLEGAQA
jgi:hypothetical protein